MRSSMDRLLISYAHQFLLKCLLSVFNAHLAFSDQCDRQNRSYVRSHREKEDRSLAHRASDYASESAVKREKEKRGNEKHILRITAGDLVCGTSRDQTRCRL